MRRNLPKHQFGSMLILALFVMVILGLLGLALANQLRTSSQNVVYEVLGSRSLLAAQSGLEHISNTAFPLNSAPLVCNQTLASAASFGTVQGLEDCQYVASCSTRTVTLASGELHYYYQFESTGACEGGGIWSSRTLAQDGFIQANP